MKNIAKVMKLLSDNTRLRILMLLAKKELCVCQIMAVLGVSQPLVSKNLNLLAAAGFLAERREGKLVFYSVGSDLSEEMKKVVSLLRDLMKGDKMLMDDLESLRDCEEFQRQAGACDMKTFREFMAKRKKQKAAGQGRRR